MPDYYKMTDGRYCAHPRRTIPKAEIRPDRQFGAGKRTFADADAPEGSRRMQSLGDGSRIADFPDADFRPVCRVRTVSHCAASRLILLDASQTEFATCARVVEKARHTPQCRRARAHQGQARPRRYRVP